MTMMDNNWWLGINALGSQYSRARLSLKRQSRMIHTIYILSKSGGLIYQQQFQERSEHADSISLNDHIVLAGMFHGFHAMSHEIDGTNTGVEKIYFGSCVLDCFLTPTGLKLFTVADRSSSDQLPKLLSVCSHPSQFT